MKYARSAIIAALAIALAACSTSPRNEPEAAQAGTTYPVTLTTASGPVTIAAKPAAIVSLSPTATEMLFAIGAGDQVIAVDDQSNFPASAPTSELSGFTPNVEAIIGRKPDLVIVSNDIDGIVASLTAAAVAVVVQPAATSLEDTYAQLIELGTATDHADQAATVVADMKSTIEAALAKAGSGEGLSVYHELDNTLYSATSSTFIGAVYKSFGLTNIADAAPDAASGYPQLSAEYLIAANPTLVFLADTKCCGVDAAQFAARPGFSSLAAVSAQRVYPLDDDIASRWGPRVADLYTAIADAIAATK